VLLPGEHQIIVRRAGYNDFAKTIVIEPGQGQTVRVVMYKTRGVPLQDDSAKLKSSVKPRRAAVFLDDKFMGPASDFGGSMKVALAHRERSSCLVSEPTRRAWTR
jgi:hypothetical protein